MSRVKLNFSKFAFLFFSLRPQQWMKNGLLFSAIFFNGKLFNLDLFKISFYGFLIFCAISSASYLFNDIIDLPHDRKHSLKKKRPLAAGKIEKWEAVVVLLLLLFFSLLGALFLNTVFFYLALLFVILHFLYSVRFKQTALLDIFSIASSFIIRVLASEALTSYHLSVWLWLTIFFAALFIASAKRHAELVKRGAKSRLALLEYEERLLNFYVATFATSTILSYILFAFMQPTLSYDSSLAQLLLSISLPKMIERKWLLLSTPLMVFGIMRYAQLIYIGKRGERPEKVITTDPLLVSAIALWGLLMFVLLYL